MPPWVLTFREEVRIMVFNGLMFLLSVLAVVVVYFILLITWLTITDRKKRRLWK